MSHDLVLWIDAGGEDRHAIYDWNATYNYQPVFEKAGMKSLSCLSGLRADVAAKVVEKVYANVRDLGPSEVNRTVKGNGTWGDYNTLMTALMELSMKLNRNPNAIVQVT